MARVLVIAAGIALLGLSMYPGLLGETLFAVYFIVVIFSPIWFPVRSIAGVVFLVRHRPWSGKKRVGSEKPLADTIGFGRPSVRTKWLAKLAPS